MSTSYKFVGAEAFQRKRDVERDGVEMYFGDATLIVRAATDANPAWLAQAKTIGNDLRRLGNKEASNAQVRKYLAGKFAELLVADWKGVAVDGGDGGKIEVPFSVEACTDYLITHDDIFDEINDKVWSHKNFRIRRVEALADEGKA